jgi:hypothetical protein
MLLSFQTTWSLVLNSILRNETFILGVTISDTFHQSWAVWLRHLERVEEKMDFFKTNMRFQKC